MATIASILEVIVKADTSQAEAGLTAVTGKMQAMGQTAGQIGATMTTFVTAPILAAGVASIKMASDFEESLNKTRVVFGDSAKSIEDFAKTAAVNLGMSSRQALESAGTFGNLFTSMGIGRDVSAQMSQQILTLAADLASFNNIDPTVALEKLRAGLVGEAEPLRALGVNLNEATIKAKAMELGLYSGSGAINAAAKAQAAYALILQQTSNAQGDFARTSDGLANSTRIAKAQFDDALTTLGSNLLPIALQAVQALNGLLTAFNNLSPGAQKAVIGIAAFVAAIGPVLSAISGMILAVQTIQPALLAMSAGFQTAIASVGGFSAIAQGALAILLSPVGLLAIAVIGLVAVIKTMGPAAAQSFNMLMQIAGMTVNQITNDFKAFGVELVKIFQSDMPVLFEDGSGRLMNFLTLFGVGKSQAQDFGATLYTIFKTDMPILFEDGSGKLQQFLTLFGSGKVQAQDFGATLYTIFRTDMPLLFEDGSGKFMEFLTLFGIGRDQAQAFGTAVWEIFNNISNTMSGMIERFYNFGMQIVQGLADGIRAAIDWVVQAATELGNAVSDTLTSLLEIKSPSRVTHRIGLDIGGGLANGINKSIPLIVKASQNAGKAAAQTLQQTASAYKPVLAQSFYDLGQTAGLSLASGLESTANAVMDSASILVGLVQDTLTEMTGGSTASTTTAAKTTAASSSSSASSDTSTSTGSAGGGGKKKKKTGGGGGGYDSRPLLIVVKIGEREIKRQLVNLADAELA